MGPSEPKTQKDTIKELAADESLSEETRESAQQALDKMASTQIARAAQEDGRSSTLQELEAETRFERRKAEAEAEAERSKLDQWLLRHRLTRHAEAFARVAGTDAAPSDLQFLTDEDIDEVGAAMTHIEKMRLQAALKAEETQASTE